MTFALEFPDSEVRDVVADDGGVRVHFSAVSVRDANCERGWLPSVRLTLAAATLAGDAAHAFGKVAEGALRLDGRLVARPALPDALAGEIELTLRFANGATLAARGRSLVSSIDAAARFADDLSC